MKTNSSRYYFALFLLLSIFLAAVPMPARAQSVATTTAATAQLEKGLEAIESRLDARRKELGIPGVAMVIVKDDQIIYLKGLGYKDLENKIAVTPDTEFAIGSATKAFTALGVLMSQDEGKLSLDDSPKKVLPYFKMYDPEADKGITIRDLLSHSSGLNRTDLAMLTGKLNRAELIRVAGEAKPTAKFREKFQYQNIMFVAAGEIMAEVQKTTWDKFVASRIFKPLGMTNSTTSMKQMEKTADHSFGYNYNTDTKSNEKLPFRDIDEIAPAGSINSSARDMAQWLRFVLNGGSVDGKRLVSETGYEEWTKPQTKIGGTASYGLGWFIQEWNGLKVLQHGGNIDGFNSMVAMIPEKKLGFVLLTNVSASPLGGEMMPVVWRSILEGPAKTNQVTREEMQKLAGKYHLAAAKFDVEIKIDGDKLTMTVPGQPTYTLENVGGRKFKPAGLPDGFAANFSPDQGIPSELELVQPNRSNKLPRVTGEDTPTSGPTTITDAQKELIGKYSAPSGGGIAEIKESDGKVTFNLPGQSPFLLSEKGKDTFSMAPLPDTYWLTAKRDGSGKLASVTVTQPQGEFDFKRLATGTDAKPLITVEELNKKAIEAAGGEENLRKFTSRVAESDVDLENQGVKGTSISWAKAPNKAASLMTFTALGKEIGKTWEFFDGETGEEQLTFGPTTKFTGKRLEDVRGAADFNSMLDWSTRIKKAEVLAIGKVGDEEAYIVSFEPYTGTPYKEYYSTKSFLLLRREGIIPISTGDQSLPYTVTLSDYRNIDGVMIAFRNVTYTPSNGTIVTTLKSVKHNVEIDDALFKPRDLK